MLRSSFSPTGSLRVNWSKINPTGFHKTQMKVRAGPEEGSRVLGPGKRNLQDLVLCGSPVYSNLTCVCSAKWSCSAQHLQQDGASDLTFTIKKKLPTPARKHRAGFGVKMGSYVRRSATLERCLFILLFKKKSIQD